MFARKIVKRVNYGFRERELHLEPRDEKNARIRTVKHFPPFSHSGQNLVGLGSFSYDRITLWEILSATTVKCSITLKI